MGQKSFFCVESWEHDFLVAERIGDSVVTPDGELVSSFFRLGPILISKQNLNRRICKRGQGPGELENLYAYCLHPEGLAFVELPYRIKFLRLSHRWCFRMGSGLSADISWKIFP